MAINLIQSRIHTRTRIRKIFAFKGREKKRKIATATMLDIIN